MSTDGGSAYRCTHGEQEPGKVPTRLFHPGVHQRNLQAQCQRRRELQESLSDRPQGDDGEPGNTDTTEPWDADVTDGRKQQAVEPGMPSSTQRTSTTSQTLQSCNEGAQPPWRSKPKRMSEGKADQAATEIVELVEQEMSSLPSHERAMQQSPEALTLLDTDVSDILAHILAESREMSKEVTPPVHLFFRDEGK